jgi:hypothetical protein
MNEARHHHCPFSPLSSSTAAGTGVKLPPGGGYDLPAGGIKLNPFNPLALRCESNASIDDEAVRRQLRRAWLFPADCQFQAKQV